MDLDKLFYLMVFIKLFGFLDIPLWIILSPLFLLALLHLMDSVYAGLTFNDLFSKPQKKI